LCEHVSIWLRNLTFCCLTIILFLSATDAFSFVDEMRQAAKHAENLNNFVYEPTSGLYYDHKTGYYYNAVNKL